MPSPHDDPRGDAADDVWDWGEDDPRTTSAAGSRPAGSATDGEHPGVSDADADAARGAAPGARGLAELLRGLADRVAPPPADAAARSGRTVDGACRHCGAHVGAADRFCASCGASLRAGLPGATRGGAVAPRLLRLGLPALVGLAVLVVVLLLVRDPLAGVRDDLGGALEPSLEASTRLTATLEALPDGGPAAVRRSAAAVGVAVRTGRREVDDVAVPSGAAGDVRRAGAALGAQQRWARTAQEVVARGEGLDVLGRREAEARRALGALGGLVDAGDARAAVGGLAAVRRAVAAGRAREAGRRRAARAAAERIAPLEALLRDTAADAEDQRGSRTRLRRIAGGDDPEGDPLAGLVGVGQRSTALADARRAAADRAASLEVGGEVEDARRQLEAAYRAEADEAAAVAECLGREGTFAPPEAAEACRERTAPDRAAAEEAVARFVEVYGPLRRAAGRPPVRRP